MENTFRSTIFGGFNRQDVANYISKTAQETGEQIRQLEKDAAEMKAELDRNATLEADLAVLQQQCEELQQALEEEQAAKADCLAQLEEKAALVQRVADLEQEVAAFAEDKEHIAELELEARRRGDEIIAEANAQAAEIIGNAQRTAAEIRHASAMQMQELTDQYSQVMEAFQIMNEHVNAELRKMEVSMSQLPLAFDRVKSELEKLKEQA